MTQDSSLASPIRPIWFGPDRDEPGLAVDGIFDIANTRRLDLTVQDVRVFAEGVAFRLVLERETAWRPDPYDPKSWTHSFNRRLPRAGRLPAEFAPEVLRLEVHFADGRKARSIDPGPWVLEPGEEPAGPVLVSLGGQNVAHRWTQDYWVWPLPEGELTLQCEWRTAGVSKREVALPLT